MLIARVHRTRGSAGHVCAWQRAVAHGARVSKRAAAMRGRQARAHHACSGRQSAGRARARAPSCARACERRRCAGGCAAARMHDRWRPRRQRDSCCGGGLLADHRACARSRRPPPAAGTRMRGRARRSPCTEQHGSAAGCGSLTSRFCARSNMQRPFRPPSLCAQSQELIENGHFLVMPGGPFRAHLLVV